MDPNRQSPLILGLLFFSGATWVSVACLDPGFRVGVRSWPMLLIPVAFAFIFGATMILGRGWDVPDWFGWLSAFGGTVAATIAAMGGPETHLTAIGGFYGYVAAYTFLFFPLRWAVLQWALSGVAFATALSGGSAPGDLASWVIVMGISAGGAGLIGSVGAHLRQRWDAERHAIEKEQELAALRATFLQAVSHELRTPLTSVLGFAKTLERHAGELDASTMASLHHRTRVQAERLHALLDDLLDLDRLQRPGTVARRQPVHLREVAANAMAQVPNPGHVMTIGEMPSEPVSVEAALVERIIVNLLSNAVRYTPRGSLIGVDADLSSDGILSIRVHDNGPGLPETTDDLFAPFVQGPGAGERSNPGTGIGLSLVRHMTRIHGGDVHTEATPGGGATFVVRLPEAQLRFAVTENQVASAASSRQRDQAAEEDSKAAPKR